MNAFKHTVFQKLVLLILCLFSAYVAPAQGSAGGIRKVSYYADKFHNRKTSNGERYNKDSFTAAHATLPFGTKLRISNPANHKSVIVRVNDRCGSRTRMDVSRAAAVGLDIIRTGVITADIDIAPQNSIVGICPASSDNDGQVAQTPNEPKKSEPVITPDKSPVNCDDKSGSYMVQVGAFSVRAYAERMLAKLRKSGFAESEMWSDGKLFKVHAGKKPTRVAADDVVKKLGKGFCPKVLRV